MPNMLNLHENDDKIPIVYKYLTEALCIQMWLHES